jgi:outer membrane protein OmpA-like peptidoglycan-associated protein
MKKLLFLFLIVQFGASKAQIKFSFGSAEPLPELINSVYEETQPVFDARTQTLYLNRSLHPANKGGVASGQDIWTSQKNQLGWGNPSNDLAALNNQLNNSVLGLSAKGDTIYLLSTYENKLSLQKGFSYSTRISETWSRPEKIHIPSLNIQGNFYSGFVDESGQIMIISMESRNSLGEEDLYVSLMNKDGWSKPIWLGDSINSEGFEISPYLFKDQTTLLFASSGHGGYGDCDIFYAYRQDSTWNNWTAPKNLGPEINSSAFDAYPFAADDLIYFTSNKGDSLSNLYTAINLDFYRTADTVRLTFKTNKSVLSEVSAVVFDEQGSEIGKYSSGKDVVIDIPNLKQDFKYSIRPYHEDVNLEFFTPCILNQQHVPIEIASFEDGIVIISAKSKESNDLAKELIEPEYDRGMGGVFELDKVPARDIILALTDANGAPTQYAITHENGGFEFAETPDSIELFVEIVSNLEYVKKNGVITFTAEDGSKLCKPDKDEDGRFGYVKLQAQEVAQMKLFNDLGDTQLEQSSGVFKFQNLPMEGVELFLVDENDNIIETVTTDENGEFKFSKLEADRGFQIKLSDEMDAQLGDHIAVLFMDNKGNELNILNATSTGGFEYKPLRSELSQKMYLLEEEDASNLSRNYVFSIGLFEYQNLPKEDIILQLLDSDDNVIETVVTDINGQFVFSMIRPDMQYKVQIGDENNLAIEETEMYFVSKDGNVTTAYNETGTPDYTFNRLNPDYFFSIQQMNEGKTELQTTESFKDISGQFKYQNLPKEGVKLYLLDEYNKVIEVVYTDTDGHFIFSKLAKDASYFVKLAEDDVSLLDEANFVIMNEKNEELEQERVAETGFNFNTLPLKFNVLAGMEEEDANHLNVLRHLTSGFFDYRNLPSERTILQLLDEYDNLIETVTTGKDGQFYFSKMEPGKAYKIRVPDIDVNDIKQGQLYFINKKGSIVTTSSEDGANVFTFDGLSDDYFDSLKPEDEVDSSFNLERTFANLFGQAICSGNPAVGQWLVISNENEVEIQRTQVQEDGLFEINRIPPGSSFKITPDNLQKYNISNLEIQLETANRKTLPITKLADGSYSFTSPGLIAEPIRKTSEEITVMSGANGDMSMLSSLSSSGENALILNVTKFHLNSVRLSDRDRAKLNGTIRQILKTAQPILVVGYSCDLGSLAERKAVAEARAAVVKEYLMSMGVKEGRFEITHIYDALDSVANPTADERVRNRKVEVYSSGP